MLRFLNFSTECFPWYLISTSNIGLYDQVIQALRCLYSKEYVAYGMVDDKKQLSGIPPLSRWQNHMIVLTMRARKQANTARQVAVWSKY